MTKQTKEQKRKAKLAERRKTAENASFELVNRLAHSLEVLCEPILSKYLDDSKNPDLEGYKIAYTIGLYAWNMCVSGNVQLLKRALRGEFYDREQLRIVEKDLEMLIERKYELYPNNTTAILDVKTVVIAGIPHAKVHIGRTFPKLPRVKYSDSAGPVSPDEIIALRKKMKLTQVKFGELFGVSARKISGWEHGRTTPTDEHYTLLREKIQENELPL